MPNSQLSEEFYSEAKSTVGVGSEKSEEGSHWRFAAAESPEQGASSYHHIPTVLDTDERTE